MELFLDLDQPDFRKLTDNDLGQDLLKKYDVLIGSIGKRRRQIKTVGISYDTPSVAFYDQAKDLYCLGYFTSTILVCRSTAEYLAYEIFLEEVNLEGNAELIEAVAENLDFRKIVNEFLYNRKKGYEVIDKKTKDLFNSLYDLGNKWVHPKKFEKKVKIEDEAFKAIDTLGDLISSLRDVLKDYVVKNGGLHKKPEGRKKLRPITLGSAYGTRIGS